MILSLMNYKATLWYREALMKHLIAGALGDYLMHIVRVDCFPTNSMVTNKISMLPIVSIVWVPKTMDQILLRTFCLIHFFMPTNILPPEASTSSMRSMANGTGT